jgi:multisubunit Na+/H+ antiporter MnhB subunit
MKILELIAQVAQIDSGKISNLPKQTAVEVLFGVLNAIYFVIGAFAVIVIILAGYTFATSVYDPEKITKAKNAILYAVVGLVAVSFAFAITQFVIRRFWQ